MVPKPNVLEMTGGKIRLSACLITHNVQAMVRDCLESLRFAGEIVVIDSYSTDQTPAICQEYTQKVFQAEWMGFSAAKNLCVEQAANEWVLVIDSDERVTPELAAEIMDMKEPADGYYIGRQNYFLGKWMRHGGWYPDYTLRLFRKSAGRFKDRAVHESLALEGVAGYLTNPFLHFTYQSLSDYIARLDRYSTLASAQMLKEMGPVPDDAAANAQPAGPGLARRCVLIANIVLRPVFTFLRMYVFRLGFLDGLHGYLLARNYSFYVFAKYAKLWEASHEK